MNIFFLDQDMSKCAEYHNDAHCSKMILEGAQLVASVIHNIDLTDEERESYLPRNKEEKPYGAGYRNHPCAKWAGQSLENYQLLRRYISALDYELHYRKGTRHHSAISVKTYSPFNIREDAFPFSGLTIAPNCTAIKTLEDGTDISKFDSWEQCFEIYRRYYCWFKSHLARWTKRPVPDWYQTLEEQKMSDRWYKQMKESGAISTKKKRRLKADVIEEMPPKVKENVPNLEKLTVAQLEGILKIV